MQLTSARRTQSGRPLVNGTANAVPRWVLPVIAAGCLVVFALDYSVEAAPLQHLYYLPIILAARYFGYRGGTVAATAAVVLYHLANLSVLSHFRYHESDIIQIALFLAAGLVTAKLFDDAERLRALAMTDDLTGLHNLRSFEAQLVGFVHEARRSHLPLSLLALDVDRLKSLNDRHGHLAGAEAVQAVGDIIAREIPAGAVACRYGGDEFAVALPLCGEREAEEAALQLCRAVSATPPQLIGRQWDAGTLSISVGVACRHFSGEGGAAPSALTDEQEGEALFRTADQALYRAKEGGRNRVHLGRPERLGAPRSAG